MVPPSSIHGESAISRIPNGNGESRPWKPNGRTPARKPPLRHPCHSFVWINHCQFLTELVDLHFRDLSHGFKLLGAVFCGADSPNLCQRVGPDLIVMDSEMPNCASIELVEDLLKSSPTSRLLVLISPESTAKSEELLAAGVHGLISRDRPLNNILSAMETVANHGCYFDDTVQHLLRPASRHQPQLTQREKAVLRLVANGLSTKEIGAKLAISTKTADKFRQRIMRKLDLHDAVQMTRYAISHGLAAL